MGSMSNWTTRAAAGGIVAALGGLTAFALTVQPAGSGAATTPDTAPVAVTQPTQTQVERRTITVTRHVRREDRRGARTTTQAAAPARANVVPAPTVTVADDHGRRHGGHGADDDPGDDHGGRDGNSGHGGGQGSDD